jgi:hypothetical protein
MKTPTRTQCELMGRTSTTDSCPATCPQYHPELPVHCGRLLVDMAALRGGFTAEEAGVLLGLSTTRVQQIERVALRKLSMSTTARTLLGGRT